MMLSKLKLYAQLIRMDKPVGILLLLWPTLWALWLAGEGHPSTANVIIFVLGVVLMRSAGCVLNDIADRHVDKFVARTKGRPLATGQVSVREALGVAGLLLLAAFLLVLQCNALTIKLSFIGALLAAGYPLLKRVTHLPQLGLGVAFSWGVPMAFAAETGAVSFSAWVLFATALLWPLIYDTMYAMADRDDDVKIGVKSTAILFGSYDRVILAILQMLFIMMLVITGKLFYLQWIYDMSLVLVAVLFVYQQWLMKDREPQACFAAFKNNQWAGLLVFAGIVMSYLL